MSTARVHELNTARALPSPGTLAEHLSSWFQNLEIDLDGARFRYHSLSVCRDQVDGLERGMVRLKLSVIVDRFPNPISTSF